MKWIKYEKGQNKLPIKSWCYELEDKAMDQAQNLSNHPAVFKHVALMPDAHCGYGMPIGGVIACDGAVIPNAVGVDIGCGMGAIQTNIKVEELSDMKMIRGILDDVKKYVPVGEGKHHQQAQEWDGFDKYLDAIGLDEESIVQDDEPKGYWLSKGGWKLAKKNLGSLGGGNHFIELRKSEDGYVWLMLHSGSRNLGYRIANYYHKLAVSLNTKWKISLPDTDLAYLPSDSDEGKAYIRDMTFALDYAQENRRKMMACFKDAVQRVFPDVEFLSETNIHHNYANLENHFEKNVWVHRKGATSAQEGQMGIIPGSMGTSSYIVRGKGNADSFCSCSHGAGRKMSRTGASKNLSVEECNEAMKGIVFDRWSYSRGFGRQGKKMLDLGEAPGAYKDIDTVIEAELDLIEPVVKLAPLGVIKG